MAAFCLLAKVTPFVGAAQVVARGQIPPLETTPDYSLSIDANGHRWAGAKRERRGRRGGGRTRALGESRPARGLGPWMPWAAGALRL